MELCNLDCFDEKGGCMRQPLLSTNTHASVFFGAGWPDARTRGTLVGSCTVNGSTSLARTHAAATASMFEWSTATMTRVKDVSSAASRRWRDWASLERSPKFLLT